MDYDKTTKTFEYIYGLSAALHKLFCRKLLMYFTLCLTFIVYVDLVSLQYTFILKT